MASTFTISWRNAASLYNTPGSWNRVYRSFNSREAAEADAQNSLVRAGYDARIELDGEEIAVLLFVSPYHARYARA